MPEIRRVAAIAVVLVAAACSGPAMSDEGAGRVAPPRATKPMSEPMSEPVSDRTAEPPSMVVVLMDDFSMDLLQTMRNALEMRSRGASYRHSYVVDSLCCVSRTSLLTGQYPHQTGVLTNSANLPNPHGPVGGWHAFREYGNEGRSVSVRLQRAGYTTAFIGKFLNEYVALPGDLPPAGWDEWGSLSEAAYDGWDFESTWLDRSGRIRVRHHPMPPEHAGDRVKDAAYAGTVTQRMALDFIRRHRDDRSPYFLLVSSYAPHGRLGTAAYPGDPKFPPAFRDRPSRRRPDGDCGAVACRRLTKGDLDGIGDDQADNAPRDRRGRPLDPWKTLQPTVGPADAVASLRDRARMVQSLDRMLGRILRAVGDDTVVVLTSDNGFHLGQHDLQRSKGTPYASDVRVPLLVVGPGIPPGPRRAVVSNIDLAPTLEALAGVRSPRHRSGRSFLRSLRDPAYDGADYAFVEHTWSPSLGGDDPDRYFSGGAIDVIPSYVAVRSRHALLVRFDLDDSWDGTRFGWEYYDYRDASFERTNSVADPAKAADVAILRARLRAFLACRGVTRDDPVPLPCRQLAFADTADR